MFLSLMILLVVALCIREHWSRLGGDKPEWNRLLWKWMVQGVAVPTFLWAFINLGFFESFPAIVPKIAIAQSNNKVWWSFWVDWSFKGAGFTILAWGAVTYTWMALVLAHREAKTPGFAKTVYATGIPMFCLAFLMVLKGKWSDLPNALLALFVPVVHNALALVEREAPVLSYGPAQGKMAFGKYEDAEIEVINQLEKKDNDFQGWMMLAELYATKYHRLEDASNVIVDLCNDSALQEVEISVACNKLADWQLEIGMNPPAARAALDLLVQRLPGTHAAYMAEMRLKQIPLTREDLLDKKKPKSIRLPALREEAEASDAADPNTLREASLEANRMSERLRHDPNDFEARERLAILLAEKLGQPNLGIEQLRLMIRMPQIMGERAAKWMAQIASWERRYNKNETKFRALLNEIIRDYPNTTHAYSARRQLQLIADEELAKANPGTPATPSIQLQVPKS